MDSQRPQSPFLFAFNRITRFVMVVSLPNAVLAIAAWVAILSVRDWSGALFGSLRVFLLLFVIASFAVVIASIVMLPVFSLMHWSPVFMLILVLGALQGGMAIATANSIVDAVGVMMKDNDWFEWPWWMGRPHFFALAIVPSMLFTWWYARRYFGIQNVDLRGWTRPLGKVIEADRHDPNP